MSSLTAYDFACAMQAHWTAPKPHGLENVSSPKLMSLWSAMGQAFLGAIQASQDPTSPDRHLWRICRPETGTGKTQGIRVFSAMVARENLKLPPRSRIGVLIVTRQTDEADRLAAEINETFARMVGEEKNGTVGIYNTIGSHGPINSPVAISRHSKPTGRATREQVQTASVLILTHASYVSALDRLEQADEDRWSSMIEWEGGTRRLTVIDETITSLLEEYSINIDALRKVLAYIPEHLRSHYRPQIDTLETLLKALRSMRERREELTKAKSITGDKSPAAPDAVVWDRSSRWRTDGEGERQLHLYGDMGGLRTEMLKLTDLVGVKRGNRVGTTLMAKLADETLQAVEMFANRWMSYHHHYIKGDTLTQTRLIFPADIPAPVVLDATASESVLWHLLGKDKVRFVDIPTGSRSYANMTLHIAVADGLGLTTMKRAEVAQDRIVPLVTYLKGQAELCGKLGDGVRRAA
jgi:hypothetical protein